jgi:hypothetical protein
MKLEFEAVKALREVLSEGRHVESSPQKHRGLRRVDVDICECGGEERKSELERAIARVLSEDHHVTLPQVASPRHRDLRRVDVNVCECGG